MAEGEAAFDHETIAGSLMEPVFVLDADRDFAYANERFLDITQLAAEDVVGADHTLLERIVEDGFPAFRNAVDAVARGDSDEERVELSMCHPEAAPVPRRLPAETRVTPLVSEGEQTGVLVVLRNVSQRKARERELERSQRRFEAVFEDPKTLVGLLDTDGTLLAANRTALDLVDADHEAVRGKPFPETPWWSHSAELQADLRQWIRRAATGEYVAFEADHVGSEGEPFSVSGTIRPVTTADGTVESLIVSANDVTERKERQHRLERQRERLDEFASVLSHDLRNPLNVASGRLELARADCESDHLETVQTALDRIDRIIERTLTLARSGQVVGETRDVDLRELALNCWGTVATSHADLRVEEAPPVRADPDQLRNLLENLFRNAVDHGGENVTVRIGPLEGGFYVADDGPGIPPDLRETVLEPGSTTDESGTGLGLYIVDEIATAHGWDVRVTDSEAGGARIEVAGVDTAR